jgi:hypothetical protein
MRYSTPFVVAEAEGGRSLAAFVTNRLLITWLTADSERPAAILSSSQRQPAWSGGGWSFWINPWKWFQMPTRTDRVERERSR